MRGMKRVILFLFIIVSSADAQSKAPVSLDLGKLNVRLGMSKVEFLSAAAKVGYKVNEDETSGYITITNDEDGGFVYSAKFKGAHLVYATRSWRDGQSDPWRALMGALSTVDNRMCRVFRSQQNTPELSYSAYFLDCGQHAVYVEESITGNGARSTDVGEIIRDPSGSPLYPKRK